MNNTSFILNDIKEYLIFISQGFRARTSDKREEARGDLRLFMLFWLTLLCVLGFATYFLQ